jgi:hypothetical protein
MKIEPTSAARSKTLMTSKGSAYPCVSVSINWRPMVLMSEPMDESDVGVKTKLKIVVEASRIPPMAVSMADSR